MALSSIHDVGTHGNAVNQSNPHTYVQHGMIDSEKVCYYYTVPVKFIF